MTRQDVVILFQLALALVLSGVLGWERERRRRAAGLRTHMLVGLSATMFVSLGLSLMQQYEEVYGRTRGAVQLDPLRLIEAVVAGVSFLGAGTIFVSRHKGVQGLTTAASVLATAAVGTAIGFERYAVAICATLVVLVVLVVVRRLEPTPSSQGSEEVDEDEEGPAPTGSGAMRRAPRRQ